MKNTLNTLLTENSAWAGSWVYIGLHGCKKKPQWLPDKQPGEGTLRWNAVDVTLRACWGALSVVFFP